MTSIHVKGMCWYVHTHMYVYVYGCVYVNYGLEAWCVCTCVYVCLCTGVWCACICGYMLGVCIYKCMYMCRMCAYMGHMLGVLNMCVLHIPIWSICVFECVLVRVSIAVKK